MCSDGLKAKQAASAHENEGKLNDEERQRLADFEAHIRRGMEQSEAGLGKTFKDEDDFLNYLRNL